MTFNRAVKDFKRLWMPMLAVPTREKYASLFRVHLEPAFGGSKMEDITTRHVDEFLAQKCEAGLSWATRIALRNLISSVYRRAEVWGNYDGKNPARYSYAGRKRSVYEKRKLTVGQTKSLLEALPPDVRVVCMVALFCGLRISEVLGLCWKHVDFDRQMFLIRQRCWRGDIDRTKSEKADRDIPYGAMHNSLRKLYPGNHGPAIAERFVFDVRTQSALGITRDDRSIRRNFLRPAAKQLGIYYRGFGFHALRREAVTAIARECGAIQACRVAGHSRLDQTLDYGLDEYAEQERAIRRIQEPYVSAGLLEK